jgi:hypothetical protein
MIRSAEIFRSTIFNVVADDGRYIFGAGVVTKRIVRVKLYGVQMYDVANVPLAIAGYRRSRAADG